MGKLLLIEFAAIELPKRALLFPYVLGWCREQGIGATWVRFAVHAHERFSDEGPESGLDLPDADRAALAALLQRERPTHVLFSDRPAPALVEHVAEQRDGVPWGMLGECVIGETPFGTEDELSDRAAAIARFLGRPFEGDEEASVLRIATPDFGFVAGNEAAPALQPLPYLVADMGCGHRTRLERNPYFADLDLPAADRSYGCTFCTWPKLSPIVQVERAKVLDDIRAMYASLPASGEPLIVRLIGDSVARDAEWYAEQILASGVAAATWQIDIRTDQLVAWEERIAGALRRLQGTGHRLQLATVGVESFTQTELDRFNKGVSVVQNLRGVEAFLRLASEHPDTLAVDHHGAFTMIAFTPWTTLDDYAFNLELVARCGLEELFGTLLGARLRLMPGRPLTARAQADGVVRERFTDIAYETSSLKMYDAEVPWDFLDPLVDVVCRLVVRFDLAGRVLRDPLSLRVAALLADADRRGISRHGLARRLTRVTQRLALADPDATPTPEEVLDAVETDPEGTAGASSSAGAAPNLDARLLTAVLEAGLKPVVKLESMPTPVYNAFKTSLPEGYVLSRGSQAKVLHGKGEDDRRLPSAHDIAWVSRDAALVERIGALNEELQEATERERVARAETEIGKLLGYPECCAAAFAREPEWEQRSNSWLSLKRRTREPGEVEPAMVPAMAVDSLCLRPVPCSLQCERAVTLARGVMEQTAAGLAPADAAELRAALRSPWLIDIDSDRSALELRPVSQPGERFHYRAGLRFAGPAPSVEMERAAEGDEIRLSEERLVVYREGLPLVDLSGRAYIWWHAQPFQAAFWSTVLAVRELSYGSAWRARLAPEAGESESGSDVDTDGPTSESAPAELAPVPLSPFVRRVRNLLGLVVQHPQFRGSLVGSPGPDPSAREVRVSLELEGDRVELIVTPRSTTPRHLFAAGPLAVRYLGHDPPTTQARREVLRSFAAALRDILAAHS